MESPPPEAAALWLRAVAKESMNCSVMASTIRAAMNGFILQPISLFV